MAFLQTAGFSFLASAHSWQEVTQAAGEMLIMNHLHLTFTHNSHCSSTLKWIRVYWHELASIRVWVLIENKPEKSHQKPVQIIHVINAA